MTIWRKVGTLFRAGAQEPLEQLVDANALRIMEQELRDTEQAMLRAKRELASLMATGKQLQRSNQQLGEELAQREEQASQALEKGEAGLAYELAEWIAAHENQLQQQRQQAEHLTRQEDSLRQHLRDAAHSHQQYRREWQLARANRNAEQVLRNLGGHTQGLHAQLGDLASSLQRIRQQQHHFSDVDSALRELQQEDDGSALDLRLQQAGINTGDSDAGQVLARLRNRQASSN
ncbi:PspA/IM30 family protein [Halopseudomonas sp.]|uniref:PspA/IM30 family protein n=1 Tax=Halopseudomonas sp. TaxID=2901191 RepID=UPI003002C0B4